MTSPPMAQMVVDAQSPASELSRTGRTSPRSTSSGNRREQPGDQIVPAVPRACISVGHRVFIIDGRRQSEISCAHAKVTLENHESLVQRSRGNGGARTRLPIAINLLGHLPVPFGEKLGIGPDRPIPPEPADVTERLVPRQGSGSRKTWSGRRRSSSWPARPPAEVWLIARPCGRRALRQVVQSPGLIVELEASYVDAVDWALLMEDLSVTSMQAGGDDIGMMVSTVATGRQRRDVGGAGRGRAASTWAPQDGSIVTAWPPHRSRTEISRTLPRIVGDVPGSEDTAERWSPSWLSTASAVGHDFDPPVADRP